MIGWKGFLALGVVDQAYMLGLAGWSWRSGYELMG